MPNVSVSLTPTECYYRRVLLTTVARDRGAAGPTNGNSLPVRSSHAPSMTAGWGVLVTATSMSAPVDQPADIPFLRGWRMHLKLEGIGPDLMPRALSAWNWSAPRVVLTSLLTERLANNPLAGVLAITVGAGLALAATLSWRRSEGKTKRLMISVALVAIAQLALLLFSYIAVFAEDEVRRAASAWRYASQVGPLLMLTVAQTLPSQRLRLWKRTPSARFDGRFYAGAVITAVAVVQLLFVGRWRIDCVYPHVRPGYDALAFFFTRIPSQASVTVINAADRVLFGDVARLARVVATRDWYAARAIIVDRVEAAPTSDYVIDLTGADPELFRKGETSLRATLYRDGFAGAPNDSVSIATSCQAVRR
jgi:hypothetical protein